MYSPSLVLAYAGKAFDLDNRLWYKLDSRGSTCMDMARDIDS